MNNPNNCLVESTLYIVAEDESHLRLDEFIFKRQSLMPIGAIRVAISLGDVLVNNRHRSSGWRLRPNDQVCAKLNNYSHLELEPENIPIEILYEDEFIIAVNKPPKMLSHPSRYERSATLLNALLYHSFNQGEKTHRLGLVHRLDRDTSGILLVAKQETALKKLAAQFDQRQVKKIYQAVVFGVPNNKSGEINAPIGWHPQESKWGVEGENSRYAISSYKVKEVKIPINNFACVELQPHTGRTHQLRIHMSYIGHPIVGDLVYGLSNNLEWQKANSEVTQPRQLLHASSLIFNHPITNQQLSLFAPIPKDMQDFLNFIESLRA